MNNKIFLLTIIFSVILMVESVWAVNYLQAAKKTNQAVLPKFNAGLTLVTDTPSPLLNQQFTVSLVAEPKEKPIQALEAIIF